MIIMSIQHRVRDYDEWKQAFDEFPPTKGGALFYRLNRGIDDPNSVEAVCGWRSVEDAEAFKSNPELAEGMKRAGAVGTPRFEIYQEVEAKEAAQV